MCKECPNGSVYTGETNRNLYTRAKEHEYKYEKKHSDSFIYNHQREKHENKDPNFNVKVVKSFKDPLSRQICEGVYIRRCKYEILNSKSEFFQPPIMNIRRELVLGQ